MLAAHNIAPRNSFACYCNAGGMGAMQADETNQTNKWAWLSTTSRYYAPSFEREVVGGKTTDYTYIEGPHGPVAAVQTSGNKHDVWLLATDHLGSIIGVWNASGTLLEEHRYSAWGLRTSSTATPRLRRGFTGHEHLPQFGLIDMQARLYDPHLGRFLAPDPYVQAPDNHQSLNRYAYCMNNPLKYVDPTGEKWWHWLLGISTVLDPISTITTLTVTAGSAAATASALITSAATTQTAFNTTTYTILLPFQHTLATTDFFVGLFSGDIDKTANAIKLEFEKFYGIASLFDWGETPKKGEGLFQLFNGLTGGEVVQSMVGNGFAHMQNMGGYIDEIGFYKGRTTIRLKENYIGRKGFKGVSLGHYVFGRNMALNPDDTDHDVDLLAHEFGHTYQSRVAGRLYIPVYGIPSANGAEWTEDDANFRTDLNGHGHLLLNRRAQKYHPKTWLSFLHWFLFLF